MRPTSWAFRSDDGTPLPKAGLGVGLIVNGVTPHVPEEGPTTPRTQPMTGNRYPGARTA